ncbi:hypothetical protein D3C72_2198060 [compost metagenome]
MAAFYIVQSGLQYQVVYESFGANPREIYLQTISGIGYWLRCNIGWPCFDILRRMGTHSRIVKYPDII